MSSRYRRTRVLRAIGAVALACAIAALGSAYRPESSHELRVCADPNNLPFSNDKQQGFENRIAELLARDLDAKLSYVWWAQRRGFVRNTISQKVDRYGQARDQHRRYNDKQRLQ